MERLANYGSDDETSTSDGSGSSGRRATDSPQHQMKEDGKRDEEQQHHHKIEDEQNCSPTHTPPPPPVAASRRTRSRSRRRHRSGSKRKHRSRSRSASRKRSSRSSSHRRSQRRRSRSPKEHRRGHEKQRDRFASRFERASNKLAHLEKMGIDIKAQTKKCDPATLLSAYSHLTSTPACSSSISSTSSPAAGGAPGAPGGGLLPPGVTDRLREQMERRKALWTKKGAAEAWEGATFAHDQEGKQANKFKRLMGIRANTSEAAETVGGSAARKQEELFTSMEQQYEVARTATHTMRGVGLGFGSYQR